jgi:hypothetical protein
MKGTKDAIAGKLMEAAHGRPSDKEGEFIAAGTRQLDVAAYFREAVTLAREPRSRGLWVRSRRFFDSVGAIVMEAGLRRLLQDAALPPEERRVIEEIAAFKQWQSAVEAEVEGRSHIEQDSAYRFKFTKQISGRQQRLMLEGRMGDRSLLRVDRRGEKKGGDTSGG